MIGLFIAALSLGLLGSLHCVGMCGPIALALPIGQRDLVYKLSSILLYNVGRALTYASMGAILGLVSKSFSVFGLQQVLSVVLGSVIFFFILFHIKTEAKIVSLKPIYQFMQKVKDKMAFLFQKKSLVSNFIIGLLNGLLPCGLVYMAMAGAITSGNAFNGALFMFFFGLGTMPAMIGVSFFANSISIRFRNEIRRVYPYLISCMAVLMILRGLNLGIPYVSPKLDKIEKENARPTATLKCCHK
jgi:sulfite exporter TauE/SafE